MSLVNVDDVPPRIRAGHSDEDVEAALSWASNAVEGYCERSFGLQTDHVVLVTPLRDRSAQLPDPPVIEVSSVEAWLPRDGAMTWVELSNYQPTQDGLIYDTTGLPGILYDGWPTWPTLPKSLRVTYTHGYTEIPQPVKDAVVKAAIGYLMDPTGRLRQIDDLGYYPGGNTSMIDDSVLSGYRNVSVA